MSHIFGKKRSKPYISFLAYHSAKPLYFIITVYLIQSTSVYLGVEKRIER